MKTFEEMKVKLVNGDINFLKENLIDYDVNQFDNYGNNILHYYILNRENINILPDILLDELIKKRIDLNAKQDKKDKRTALHLAVFIKSKEIFDLLIKANVEIDIQDVNGNTPLWLSIMNYRKEEDSYFSKILLSKGANPNFKNIHDISPKELANNISNYDIKKLFSNVSD